MELLQLQLRDRDRRSMWSLPDTNLVFTYESPGPLSVDLDKLSDMQINTIVIAINSRVLYSPDLSQLQLRLLRIARQAISDEPRVPRVENPDKDLREEIKEAQEAKAAGIKDLLSKHASTIKAKMPGLEVSALRMLMALEANGKGRKTILKLAKDLISKHQQELNVSLSQSRRTPEVNYSSDKKTFAGLRNVQHELITEIDEGEFEHVEIPIEN